MYVNPRLVNLVRVRADTEGIKEQITKRNIRFHEKRSKKELEKILYEVP
jgi:hypothetical protein